MPVHPYPEPVWVPAIRSKCQSLISFHSSGANKINVLLGRFVCGFVRFFSLSLFSFLFFFNVSPLDRISVVSWRLFWKIYRGESCLWKIKCKGYHDKSKRDAAYKLSIEKRKEIVYSATKSIVEKYKIIVTREQLPEIIKNSKGIE